MQHIVTDGKSQEDPGMFQTMDRHEIAVACAGETTGFQ